MRYISTRGLVKPGNFKEILLVGLASDGGLYVPEEYPKIDLKYLENLRGMDYVGVAKIVLAQFISDIPTTDLNRLIAATYTQEMFGEGIIPLKWLQDDLALLQLSNGPTLAFKDVPLQLLGNLMEYVLENNGEELNILGATSGDTGSAAEYAFKSKSAVRVFMLSPHGRMSRFQQRQMYTLDVPNVHNLVVNGTFDDCQTIVKAVNADVEFKERYKIGAVNSINWARIAAQVVYYVYAYLQAAESIGDEVSFAVPSGNFGNALAAHVAKQAGLPIHEIIVATNENDVLDQFFRSGIYRVRKGNEVKVTSSPSMDIASASNFERFMFDYVGRDLELLHSFWDQLGRQGEFNLGETNPGKLFGIYSGSATDAEVLKTIRAVYEKYCVIIDPHTAVAMKVGLERCTMQHVRLVVAETAQPAKFADTIREALGFEAPVPKGYEGLEDLPEHTVRIDLDPEAVKRFIADHTN